MTAEDSIFFGMIIGVALWAAAIGGIAILGAWLLVLFGANIRTTGDIGDVGTQGAKAVSGATSTVTEPAEEGGKLDEWESDRRDRAA
ncbi:MAG: hypothetical protein HY896_06045 [Deltaproteobacteria bacterium]|nr:hypothetical protein [Deltaproteobacteria bacterium]